jgi:hypothetical protein
MTAKQQVLAEAPDWTEAQAELALRAAHGEWSHRTVDEWGDLSSMTRAAADATMRRLDEEERAQFGETLAEAWGRGPKRS